MVLLYKTSNVDYWRKRSKRIHVLQRGEVLVPEFLLLPTHGFHREKYQLTKRKVLKRVKFHPCVTWKIMCLAKQF